MLILSRKVDQSIIIGGHDGKQPARVMVVKIVGDTVRLGVEAAGDVPVDREEVHQRKVREQESSQS